MFTLEVHDMFLTRVSMLETHVLHIYIYIYMLYISHISYAMYMCTCFLHVHVSYKVQVIEMKQKCRKFSYKNGRVANVLHSAKTKTKIADHLAGFLLPLEY